MRIHDGPSDASDIMTEYNCNSTLVNRTFFSSGRGLWLEVKTGIPENSIAMRMSYEAQEKQGKSTRIRGICRPSLNPRKGLKCS